MTERLAQLLHDEADVLDIPTAPAADVIGRGRSIRRRRRATGILAAAAVLGVIGGGAALVTQNGGDSGGGRQDTTTALSPAQRYLSGGAYAVGSTVFFGDPANDPVTLDTKIKALYYTAGGVLVRSGDQPFTDDSGPSYYALVTPTGDVGGIDLELGDRVPATSPGDDRLVYADGSPGNWEVVVHDLATDTETKRIPIDGAFTWGGWAAPPVALSGDTAYVAMDDDTLAVDLTTGDSAPAGSVRGGTFPEIAGGRAVVSDYQTSLEVIDVETGDSLLQVDLPEGHHYGELSPDGRYLKLVPEERIDENGELVFEDLGFSVYDVETGKHVDFDEDAWDLGWSPDGHLLKVTRKEVTVCEPTTGDCTTEGQVTGKGMIKIGGRSYES